MLLIWVWTFASYICHSQLSLCQILISDPEQRISIFEDICPVMSKISFLLNWYFIARSVRLSIGLLPVGVKEFILNKRFASLSLVTLVCVFVTRRCALTFILKAYENSFPVRYVLQFLPAPGHLVIETLVNVKVKLYSFYTNFTLQVYLFRTAVFRLAKKNWHEKGRISEV